MKFADKLRELREAAGLSEAKLAAKSGVTFGCVHNYGLGRREPTFGNVIAIARALGVDCNAFAGCDDVKPTEKNRRVKRAKRVNSKNKRLVRKEP
jgi:transcriptional regulator with XRE-family HTH domain